MRREEGCHGLSCEKGDQSRAVVEHGVGTAMPITEMSDVASIERTTHGNTSVKDAHAVQGERGFRMREQL